MGTNQLPQGKKREKKEKKKQRLPWRHQVPCRLLQALKNPELWAQAPGSGNFREFGKPRLSAGGETKNRVKRPQ